MRAFFPPATSSTFARLTDIDDVGGGGGGGGGVEPCAVPFDPFDALDEHDDDGEFDRDAYELDFDVDGASELDESALAWRERVRRVARRALAALRRVPIVVDARRTLRRQWRQMAFAVAWLLVGLLAMDVATLGASRIARRAAAATPQCNATHGAISDVGFAFFHAVWPDAAWPKPPGAWLVAPSVAIATWLGVIALRVVAHRRGLTVLRRVFFLYGLLALGRAVTLDWTVYPDPSYECTRRALALANSTAPAPSFLSELVHQSPLWTCGDMMYSGHAVLYCVGWLTSLFYASHVAERVAASVLLVASAATLVLARVHYTADVVVAILICTPTYALYHVVATTDALCARSRFVRWFESQRSATVTTR